MGWEQIGWAYSVKTVAGKRITPIQKLLLLTLADMADENWSCFPSQSTLADKTSISERTIRDQLQVLQDDGLLYRVRRASVNRGRLSDRYYLRDQPEALLPVGQDVLPANSVTTNRQIPTTNRQNMTINRQPVAGTENPYLEPSVEPSISSAIEATIQDRFEVVWRHWPKKADRLDAERKFRTTVLRHFPPSGSPGIDWLVKVMLDHAQAYRSYRPDPTFTPGMAVWLNKQRWNEKPISAPIGAPGRNRSSGLEGYDISMTDEEALAALA